MWEFPSIENAATYDEGETQLAELLGELGFHLELKPMMVKELPHIFSHRKWFMKAFKGTVSYVGSEQNSNQDTASVQDVAASKQGGNTSVQNASTQSVESINKQLPKDWMLIKRSEFADYAWAGPHGKLTELCPL